MNLRSFLEWLKSNQESPPPSTDWHEKRKDNRVDLPPEHLLKVRLLESSGQGSAFGTMRNVSVRGGRMVLENAESLAGLTLGRRLKAVLVVDGAEIPLTLEVMRLVGKAEVGVRFVPPYPKELERLERFLEPRCLGRSLREINAAALQPSPGQTLRWFQGVNETGLFTWVAANGRIVQQQLVFLDNVVEWSDTGAARTGKVRTDAADSGPGWVRSELLDFDVNANPAVLDQAKTLLESSLIEENVRKAFLEKLV